MFKKLGQQSRKNQLRQKLQNQSQKPAKKEVNKKAKKAETKPAMDFNMPSIDSWTKDTRKKKYVPEFIEEILPREPGEYLILAGRTGIGKTNLMLHMAYCLATGTPFFGLKCEKVNVGLIAYEGAGKNMADRIDKIRKHFPKTEGRLRFTMMPVQNPGVIFDEVWEKVKNCDVLFIDPIKYMVSGEYLTPKDANSFISEFRQELIKHNLTAVATLPITKPGNKKLLIHPNDVYAVKGATDYCDSATTVLLLEKKPNSQNPNKVKLYFAKHRIASKDLGELDLVFNKDLCAFSSDKNVGEFIIGEECCDEDTKTNYDMVLKNREKGGKTLK